MGRRLFWWDKDWEEWRMSPVRRCRIRGVLRRSFCRSREGPLRTRRRPYDWKGTYGPGPIRPSAKLQTAIQKPIFLSQRGCYIFQKNFLKPMGRFMLLGLGLLQLSEAFSQTDGASKLLPGPIRPSGVRNHPERVRHAPVKLL